MVFVRFLLFLFVCAYLPSISQNQTKKVIISDGIGVDRLVLLGETKRKIKQKFGKTEECEGNIGSYIYVEGVGIKDDTRKTVVKKWKNLYCYASKGIKIHFKKNKVNSIFFKNNLYQTVNGISIGENRANVLTAYGGFGDSPVVIYYDYGIAFYFNQENNTVVQIEIFPPVKRKESK